MNEWVVKAVFAVLLSGMSLASSPARAAEVTSDALLTCANEADDARRLRCFDAAVANLRKAPTAVAASAATTSVVPAAKPNASPAAAAAAPAPAAAAPAAAASAVSAEDKFGARGDLRPDSQGGLSEIAGTVTALDAKPYGELVITLDNGQVWAELAPSKVKLKTGDSVKIEAGALGSYRLIAPNGRSSKVARVR